jgi:hypothetical protein
MHQIVSSDREEQARASKALHWATDVGSRVARPREGPIVGLGGKLRTVGEVCATPTGDQICP